MTPLEWPLYVCICLGEGEVGTLPPMPLRPRAEAEASLGSSYSQSSSTHSEGPQVLPQVPMKTLQGGGQHEAEPELKLEWVS